MTITTTKAGSKDEQKEALLKLLFWMERHDFITPPQLSKYLRISPQGARKKLRQMECSGLLASYRPNDSPGTPIYYFITQDAASMLVERYELDESAIVIRRSDDCNRPSLTTFWHTEGINDFFLGLLDEGLKRDLVGLTWWSSSKNIRIIIPDPEEILIPDGGGEFDNGFTTIPFLFEHDRMTETGHKVMEKFRKYIRFVEYFKPGDYKLEKCPRVFFLSTNENWAKTVKEMVEDYVIANKREDLLAQHHFLVSWTDNVSAENLLEKRWMRIMSNELCTCFPL